jgi:hypothetical protein
LRHVSPKPHPYHNLQENANFLVQKEVFE